ncbi:MAG TPA: tannase/feruloyl esterase family alpha/beta hydrolase [Steroidobacteraceae bacterium]|nr:tannase/feruloyl esterase family alpha/beta hydrolase [Steroidobacteraceae bacterium]
MYRVTMRPAAGATLLLGASLILFGSPVRASPDEAPPSAPAAMAQAAGAATVHSGAAEIVVADLASMCRPAAMQAIASRLSIKVQVQELPREEPPGPFLTGGTAFKPESKELPAYCQVTGSFVTNPKTGKTANFLATFPAVWNQKYLQLGCGGHCGTFAVSDAASPAITITNQGKPGESISKGYASFATDEGHAGFLQGQWAVQAPGRINEDALEDFLYRANKVLARMGKEFTTAFYAQATGTPRKISYAYFCGCSGGGRDALVAAAYFPEEFDGIIAGSAYANMANLAFLSTGVSLATIRTEDARVPPALIAQIDPIVKAKCDALDGVKDGLIQNPAACDFLPQRDLPRCAAGSSGGDHCFTEAQIQSVSTLLTAVTDAQGNIVQPGYTVSEVQPALLMPPADPGLPDPWPDTGNPATSASGGMGLLGDAVLRVFTHRDDPDFHTRMVISFGSGGSGQVTGYRVIVPAAEVAKANEAMRMGIGDIPRNAAKLIKLDHKLLIWANLSDQLLTPYMSINYYKRLAKMYGGYAKLQRNIRLFAIPGTAHCSGGSVGQGPGSFDALSAMERWAEKREAPDGLLATLYQPTAYGVDFSKPLGRTMPLCKFPEMAHYGGKGDVKDAANWSCPAGDTSMLKVGASGRQAGVVP